MSDPLNPYDLSSVRKNSPSQRKRILPEEPCSTCADLRAQLRAAEESNGKLRKALEYISENRTCGALDDCSHVRCNSTHVVKMFARAALVSAPTQGPPMPNDDVMERARKVLLDVDRERDEAHYRCENVFDAVTRIVAQSLTEARDAGMEEAAKIAGTYGSFIADDIRRAKETEAK